MYWCPFVFRWPWTCPDCAGTGKIVRVVWVGNNPYSTNAAQEIKRETCPRCGGTGHIYPPFTPAFAS